MFEKSFKQSKRFAPGELVESEVVAISGDCIFFHLDGKSEGCVDASQFADKEGKISVNVGDKIKVFFIEAKNGEMVFAAKVGNDKNASFGSAILENAFENGIPVDGKVSAEIKGGFEVLLGESRAFCPFSQMGSRRVENAAEYVGKTLTFKIIEYGENGRNILVSNRAIIDEERKANIEGLKDKIVEGAVVKGVVKSLQDFGAFVDVEGFQVLLPISEISRDRVEKIADFLAVGQEIEAEVLRVDWKSERVSVSMKALTADPWDEVVAKYSAGTRHEGEVVRVAQFGAFVNLEPGIDGLVHVSELGSGSRDNNVKAMVKLGQKMTVEIISVDKSARRIALKPFVETEDTVILDKYSDGNSNPDTYNPFADLLKK
ncbi:MAG: S1 RNA-binding domain-containing protein [Spirochaetales bacterium]|nr:S1 RNA-binding domain-containing protein [Spirochaetales bacterium]